MLTLEIQMPIRNEGKNPVEAQARSDSYYRRLAQIMKPEVHTWTGTVTLSRRREVAQVILSYTLASHRETADVVSVTWPDEVPSTYLYLSQICRQFRADVGRQLWRLKKFVELAQK